MKMIDLLNSSDKSNPLEKKSKLKIYFFIP